jgi:penicillin-binding protein 1A
VTPLDLTAAFTIFPSMGRLSAPRGMLAVADADGDEVFSAPVVQKQVISPQVAFQMVSMLSDVVDRGTASAVRSLGVRGPVAGKTGTTNEYKDAWFIGFSTSVVAGVWVGFDQPAPIGSNAYAARIAVPIWADFMKRTAASLPATAFQIPEGVSPVELCSVSFAKPVSSCPVYTEYFKTGDVVPSALCTIHKGSFSERASVVVDTFFRSLGRRISGIFRRR